MRLTDVKTNTAVPFLGITATAKIDPAFSGVELAQRYRNDGPLPIETVYTFALPKDAVLLGLEAKIGKARLKATVAAAKQASRRYEAAIEAGHAAVLVEAVGQGLFTANLGNLLPGETAEITLTYAEANRWENGRLRWRLPTTVAPRYGKSDLQPHQQPETAPEARYEASFEIRLDGALKAAKASSPSHVLETDGSLIRPKTRTGGVTMDRDIVIDLELARQVSTARRSTRGDDQVLWASFVPSSEWTDKGPRNLKIVLDCSGSMDGDSITAARLALEAILSELGDGDRFNLIRFGSGVERMFPCQVEATPDNLRLAEACARHIKADMGGTEMMAALDAAYASEASGETAGDIIFITDGQAWNHGLVEGAVASGHRIFTIGVGNAVQEELLRRLAEETGGAAEFVVPGEALQATIERQFRRIRSGSVSDVKISWPGRPKVTTALPKAIFAGSAIHAAAFYAKSAKVSGRATLSFRTAAGRKVKLALDLAKAGKGSTDEVRLAAHRRIEALLPRKDDAKIARDAEALALAYELVTPWTSLIVVRKGVRAETTPVLHKVQQMTPAGWGMFAGSSRAQSRAFLRSSRLITGPAEFRLCASSATGLADPCTVFSFGHALEAPHAGWLDAGGIDAIGPVPDGNAQAFAARLEQALVSGGLPTTIDGLVALGLTAQIEHRLRALVGQYDEQQVVEAFIAIVFEGAIGVSMAAHASAAALRARSDPALLTSVAL